MSKVGILMIGGSDDDADEVNGGVDDDDDADYDDDHNADDDDNAADDDDDNAADDDDYDDCDDADECAFGRPFSPTFLSPSYHLSHSLDRQGSLVHGPWSRVQDHQPDGFGSKGAPEETRRQIPQTRQVDLHSVGGAVQLRVRQAQRYLRPQHHRRRGQLSLL